LKDLCRRRPNLPFEERPVEKARIYECAYDRHENGVGRIDIIESDQIVGSERRLNFDENECT
jgi:hypothetical protein